MTGGCRPNRETERSVEAAGFRVDASTRRARGTWRRLEARAPHGAAEGAVPLSRDPDPG